MDLMTKEEYAQACLFRIREALETTKKWWGQDFTLDKHKFQQTMNMLEDIMHELEYFQQKLTNPLDDPLAELTPVTIQANPNGGLFKE